MSKSATVLVLVWVLVSVAARGDIIYLSNGKKLEGVIVRESSEGIEVRTRGSKLSIPQSGVLRIQRENSQSNSLHQARFLLEKGEASEAAQQVEEALRLGLPATEARSWCTIDSKIIERALDKADLAEAEEWKSLIRRLGNMTVTTSTAPAVATTDFSCPVFSDTTETLGVDDKRVNEPDMRDFLVAMIFVFRNTGDQAFSSELLGYLDGEAIRQACAKSDKFETVLLDEVKVALDRMDFRRASLLVGRMQDAKLMVSESTQILLLLRWASFERQRGNYDSALAILAGRLKPLSPVLAQERLSSTLTEMQVAYRKSGDYGEAAGMLEKWGREVPGNQAAEALVLVYREWGESLLRTEPARARLAFVRYYELQPKEEKKTYLQQCDFFEKYNALDKQDYASAFELGKWAVEQGLVTEAISAYEKASVDERLKQPAEEQIGLLQDQIAVTHMDKCMKLFENGNPEAALDEIAKFPYLPAARRVGPEIQKLRTVCLAEIARRQQIREVQAESEFQAAQRDFFLGNADDAIKVLTSLTKTYQGTGVAARVNEFLRYARTMRTLNRLEGVTEKSDGKSKISASPNSELEKEVASLIQKLGMDTPVKQSAATSVTATTTDTKTSESLENSDSSTSGALKANDLPTSGVLKTNDSPTSAALKTNDPPTSNTQTTVPPAPPISSQKSSVLPKSNDFE